MEADRVGGNGPAFAYFAQDELAKARGLFSLVDETGAADAADVAFFDRERCRELFRGMLMIRVMDAVLMNRQRQGRIGFYGEAVGQEAAVVGTAAAAIFAPSACSGITSTRRCSALSRSAVRGPTAAMRTLPMARRSSKPAKK